MSKLRFSKKFRKDSNASNIPEEQIKNKFDYNYNNYNSTYTKKYKNKYPSSRKYSKDSSNLSTSNEDIQESIQPPNFKAKASDFKIKYKTELCKYYELTGQCKFGNNCAYAHGRENLRSKVTNTTAYRTKKCIQFFENGYCPYGNRCQFRHQFPLRLHHRFVVHIQLQRPGIYPHEHQSGGCQRQSKPGHRQPERHLCQLHLGKRVRPAHADGPLRHYPRAELSVRLRRKYGSRQRPKGMRDAARGLLFHARSEESLPSEGRQGMEPEEQFLQRPFQGR